MKAEGKFERLIKRVCKEHGVNGKVKLSVSLVKDEEITKLNKKHLGKDRTTDVLSFPLEKELGPDGVLRLGDVVVNVDEAERQAIKAGVKVSEQIEFLVEHGILHLLGVHH